MAALGKGNQIYGRTRSSAGRTEKRRHLPPWLLAIVVVAVLALITSSVILLTQVGTLKGERDAALASAKAAQLHGVNLQKQLDQTMLELSTSKSQFANLQSDFQDLQTEVSAQKATNAACDDLISLMRSALSTASRSHRSSETPSRPASTTTSRKPRASPPRCRT